MIFQKSREGSPRGCSAEETGEGPTNRGDPAGETGSRRSLGESNKGPWTWMVGVPGQPQWGLLGGDPQSQLCRYELQSPCGLPQRAKQVHAPASHELPQRLVRSYQRTGSGVQLTSLPGCCQQMLGGVMGMYGTDCRKEFPSS